MEYIQSPEAFPLFLDDCCPGVNDRVNETLRIAVQLKVRVSTTELPPYAKTNKIRPRESTSDMT
jgi:hypothetical protein